jgi:hypothetical protein
MKMEQSSSVAQSGLISQPYNLHLILARMGCTCGGMVLGLDPFLKIAATKSCMQASILQFSMFVREGLIT